MSKISVIIPVYNVGKYIERCARSLFEQTLDDIEYLFIDDCSQDNSIEILCQVLKEYGKRNGQVIIHRMERNSGQAAVREWGIRNAKGEYIIQCDSDDWVEIDLYEKMYKLAKKNNIDVVVCDIEKTDEKRCVRILGGQSHDINVCINELMHQKMKWSLCNKLIKRELFGDDIVYPVDAMGEDMCITLQIMKKVSTIDYIRGRYFYYTNTQSIVNVNSKEKILQKYEQLSRNVDILVKAYWNYKDNRFSKGVTYLKFIKNDLLVPLTKEKKYYQMWKQGIDKLSLSVLLDKGAQLKDRIKAFLVILSLYPLLYTLFKRIR